MPIISGVETVSAIRREEDRLAFPRVVIVGVTGNAISEDLLEFKLAGCHEVMIDDVLILLSLIAFSFILCLLGIDEAT